MSQWYDTAVSLRDKKLVAKIWDDDGSFRGAVHIPSVKYPLNGKYEVFNCNNTEIITQEEVLAIFDRQTYKIGWCYSNTRHLVDDLRKAGFDARSYCGWLFVGAGEYPIHHCWTVVEGKYLLDLSDDHTVLLSGPNGKHFEECTDRQELYEMFTSFQLAAKQWRHRDRCSPVGKPFPRFFYVGCECDPEEGVRIYQKMMAQYPNHECVRKAPGSERSPLQEYMARRGVY